jgi:ribosomal protein S19
MLTRMRPTSRQKQRCKRQREPIGPECRESRGASQMVGVNRCVYDGRTHSSTGVARDTLPVGPGDPSDDGASGTLAREDG